MNKLTKLCLSFIYLLSTILISNSRTVYADHLDEHTEYVAINHSAGEIVGTILPAVPGNGDPTDRVEYRLKLYKGKMGNSNQDVYFVITDASDKDFARRFGALHSEFLKDVSQDAIEQVRFRDDGEDGAWKFSNDPGRVSRISRGQLLPPRGNERYSPLKKISYDVDGPGGDPSIEVIVNAPFIKWGDGPGQTLLIDTGGCNPLIRSNPPSNLLEGNGPPGCENDPVDAPLARYSGPQVTALDITETGGTVTMKLHQGTFRTDVGHHVYYMTFESSKGPAAGFMGVVHAPKLANLSRSSKGIGTVTQFGNGVADPSGGPSRFQHGMVSYPAESTFYTPMWHIRTIFWDLDKNKDGVSDGIVLDNECNQSFEPLVDPSLCGNQDAPGITFDPFQVHNGKGNSIKGVAFSKNDPIFQTIEDGLVPDLITMAKLIKSGELLLMTDSPGGLVFDDANEPHIVNCPSPVTVKPIGSELVPVACQVDEDCPENHSCVFGHGPGLCYNFDL